MLALLLARVPALAAWLAAAPTASGGLSATVLAGLVTAAPNDDALALGDVAPIVIALIAAAGTVAVAVINNRRSRPTVVPASPVDDVPPAAAVRVLEANIATVRREAVHVTAAIVVDVEQLRADVDRLTRRLENHLDRGSGRIPAQRSPSGS